MKISCKIPDEHQKVLEYACKAYLDVKEWVSTKKDYTDFYGLRDFYHTVKFISKKFLHVGIASPNELNTILKLGFERNFGGKFGAMDWIEDRLNNYFMYDSECAVKDRTRTLDLIKQNIEEDNTRFLMIIAQTDVATFLLKNNHITSSTERKLLIGSSFEKDKHQEEIIFRNLSEVMRYIDTEKTLILQDMQSIYSSLYDLFNQNYSVYGNRNYCKIALGTHFNPRCFVNNKFKCIIFIEDDDQVIKTQDPPFLNRFEKHWVTLSELITPEQSGIIESIDKWVENLTVYNKNNRIKLDIGVIFPIFSKKSLPYLVMQHSDSEMNTDLLRSCMKTLIKSAPSDLIILADISDISQGEKDYIHEIWKSTHQATFEETLQALQYSSDKSNKIIALTYDSISVTSVISNSETIVFQKLSNITSETDLLSDLQQFYASSTQTLYIIELVYSIEFKHLLLLKSSIEGLQTIDREQCKSFVILIRMHRNDRLRPTLRFDISWDLRMFENLTTNSCEILEIREKELMDLIIENRLFKFEEHIADLIENTLLTFKYESPSSLFDAQEYKIEIARKIQENESAVENLKGKTFEFVKSKIGQSNDTGSWKIALFTDGNMNSEAINLEHALMFIIKKEIQIKFSFIIFLIENKNALNSLVTSIGNREMYEYWESSYKKLQFEGIKMKNAINENVLHFVDILETPYIFETFLQLNQIFRDSIAEFEEAKRIEEQKREENEEYQHTEGNKQVVEGEEAKYGDIKPPIFNFMRILNEELAKETIKYFNTASFKESILRDFIKIIISENSQVVSNEKLLTIIPKYITPYETTFEIIFSLFDKENEIIEFNNLMSILEGLISNSTQSLMQTILITLQLEHYKWKKTSMIINIIYQ